MDSVTQLVDGQLRLAGRPSDDGAVEIAWTRLGTSKLFAGEYVEYHLVSANQAEMLERVKKALELVEERTGLVGFVLFETGDNIVVVRAKIDLDRSFARTAPDGLAPGGDLIGDWNSLDGSTWTPPVSISSDGSLPPRLQGAPIMPGKEDGTLLIPDVPEERSVEGLLQGSSAPIPSKVVDSIWKSISNVDAKLKPLRPNVKRFVPARDAGEQEPAWVGRCSIVKVGSACSPSTTAPLCT